MSHGEILPESRGPTRRYCETSFVGSHRSRPVPGCRRAMAEEPAPPAQMTLYYLALLHKGAAWTPEQTPEVKSVLKGHLANIRRLAAEGKLILAGPFEGDGELRGLFLLQAGSLQEAQQLIDSDPAVKRGVSGSSFFPGGDRRGIRVETAPMKRN
jgi:uncharacterized protein YciI